MKRKQPYNLFTLQFNRKDIENEFQHSFIAKKTMKIYIYLILILLIQIYFLIISLIRNNDNYQIMLILIVAQMACLAIFRFYQNLFNFIIFIQEASFIILSVQLFNDLKFKDNESYCYYLGWISCMIQYQFLTLSINIIVKVLLIFMFLGEQLYFLAMYHEFVPYIIFPFTLGLILLIASLYQNEVTNKQLFFFETQDKNWNERNLIQKVIGSNVIIFSLDPIHNQFYLNSANDNAIEVTIQQIELFLKNFEIEDDLSLKELLRKIKVPLNDYQQNQSNGTINLLNPKPNISVKYLGSVRELQIQPRKRAITLERAVFLYLQKLIDKLIKKQSQFQPETLTYNVFVETKECNELLVTIKITIFDPINLTLVLFIEEEQVQQQIQSAKLMRTFHKTYLDVLFRRIFPQSIIIYKKITKLLQYYQIKNSINKYNKEDSTFIWMKNIQSYSFLLINEVINFQFFNDPETPQQECFIQQFKLQNFLKEVTKLMNNLAKMSKLKFEVINKVFSISKIISNERLLTTILLNIYKNALQFSEPGSKIKMEISVERNLNPMMKDSLKKRQSRGIHHLQGTSSSGMGIQMNQIPSVSLIKQPLFNQGDLGKLDDSLDKQGEKQILIQKLGELVQNDDNSIFGIKQKYELELDNIRLENSIKFIEEKQKNSMSNFGPILKKIDGKDQIQESVKNSIKGYNQKVRFDESEIIRNSDKVVPVQEKQQLLKFSIKNIGKQLTVDHLRQLILNPQNLNEIDHNLSQEFKLGLAVSRFMLGLIGPYNEIFLNHYQVLQSERNNVSMRQIDLVQNELIFYIYSNIRILDKKFKSSIMDPKLINNMVDPRTFQKYIY